MAGRAIASNKSRTKTWLRRDTLLELYGVRDYIGSEEERELGLRVPFDVYFKDPLVADKFPGLGIDTKFYVPWEPGIGDGPTSSRFAVVDYDASTETLNPPADWDGKRRIFTDPQGREVDEKTKATPQFRQVCAWANLQSTLDHFEGGYGLGRRIMWAFEGNRLIVVPHAGYGENAFYDRQSKSLQFYYFKRKDGALVYTCLSSDIVNHEFAHAVLDGIRPYYLEAVSPETAAFHEFMGDMTAILMALRNNAFRQWIVTHTKNTISSEPLLFDIAQEFGAAVSDEDYLRSASNTKTMETIGETGEPHALSEVLTGAVFDFFKELAKRSDRGTDDGEDEKTPQAKKTVATNFWETVRRVQRMAIQPLDLLPPVEVTFADYARAALRAEFVANPVDPKGYRQLLADAFVARKILSSAECENLLRPDYMFRRIEFAVTHDVRELASSRAAAYRFLDDNRTELFIPAAVDLIVPDVFTADKLDSDGRRLPKQIILQYVWREEIVLEGPRFGAYAGQATTMLCGATLVMDENGSVIHWARKPGSQAIAPTGAPVRDGRRTKVAIARDDEVAEGRKRREAFLAALEGRIAAGMVGEAFGGPAGVIADSVPLFAARQIDGALRFELTPHMSAGHDHESELLGGRGWSLSS